MLSWGVRLIWIIVGEGPTALAEGVGGGCLDIISLVYHFSHLPPSLWETARYRLKYCLKGPLNTKQSTNQLESQRVKRLPADLISGSGDFFSVVNVIHYTHPFILTLSPSCRAFP